MHTRSAASTAWLGLTPEPERSLPELLAHLRDDPSAAGLRSEQNRASNLVLRGTGRRWLRYLDRAAGLALDVADGRRNGDAELALTVAQLVLEHDRMLIGLPGNAYYRTAERRRRLAQAIAALQDRIEGVEAGPAMTASLTRVRVQRWPGLSGGLLADAVLDRESAADYLGSGGYREVADLPDRLAASGLRGRGGAAFPVARKLDAVLARRGPRVVVANGEEGEPASIKDRYLLLHRPHLVLDGLRLMARAAAADRAYVYVSDPAVAQSVAAALGEVAAGWDIAVSVFTVDHTYVAGEESALVRAIDGGPALPTAKPPRAYESGVGGAPTLVQNVETLAHVALIAAGRGGGDTFLATLTGAGHPPALLELPFGVRLGDVVGDVSGLRGATVGGLFGGLLADPWRVPLRYDDVRALGSGLGCGAFGLLGIDDCPVDAAADAVAYLAAESARQCGVCVNATAGMRDVLAGLRVGTTTADDVIRLAGWTQRVPGRGACALIDAAARMAASLLHEFPAEVEAHLAGPCSRCAHLGPLPRHTRNHLEMT